MPRLGWVLQGLRAFVLFPLVVCAQDLTVYSEFTRIDPLGRPVRADRGAHPPREILSPAIARNAFSSFHVVVEGRPGTRYTFQVSQNPDNAVTVTAYRELYRRVGSDWVPDVLEPVKLPYDGQLGDPSNPTQTAQAFWMDLFAGRHAPVRRIKVEPQVYIDDGWIRYPMEVRVSRASLGLTPPPPVRGVADPALPSAAPAWAVWTTMLCSSSEKKDPDSPLSIRNFIARNAAQDIRLAAGVIPAVLLRQAGVADRAGMCRAAGAIRRNAEDYLRVRDALIGARE